MTVPKKVMMEGSRIIGSWIAASRIPFGAAVTLNTRAVAGGGTIKAAEAAASGVLGFANARTWTPKGHYEGFYEAGELVEVVAGAAVALVQANGADYTIDLGDYLEIATLGDGTPGPHGTLEEAGSHAGGQFTVDSVAQSLESVDQGDESYFSPHSAVTAGDTTITMGTSDISTMGIEKGSYIILEDTGASLGVQVNRVAAVTSTVITLEIPAAFALGTDHDLVTRLDHVKVRQVA